MSEESIKYKLTGAEALISVLKELPQVTEEKVMTRGLSRAGARLRTYMRRAATKVSGLLRQSIGLKKIGRRKNNPKYKVGLLQNFYYKTLDGGRKAFTRKDGSQVKAQPTFQGKGTQIENTYLAKREEIANLVVEEATKEFAKETGKLVAKSGYRKGAQP